MKWKISFYSTKLQEQLLKMPKGMLARYLRYLDLMQSSGANLGAPHTKALGNGLFELRIKSKEGISRVFYCTMVGKELVMLHYFIKKTQAIPKKELEIAIKRMKEIKS